MKTPVSQFIKNKSGTTLVELSLILPILLSLTLGICEFGFVLFQNNSAQKATQVGARYAATRAVLIDNLEDCLASDSGYNAGDDCHLFTDETTFSQTCVDGSGGCEQAAFDAIFAQMQAVYPDMQKANLRIVYTSTGLGFVGRGRPVPAITVELINMQYNYIFFGEFLNFGSVLNLDHARTTTIAEDLTVGEG